MAESQLITPEDLHKLLSYDPDTGEFYWRVRPEDYFNSKRAQRIWNTRYASKPALSSAHVRGYLYGRILDRNYLAHRVAWALHHNSWPEGEIDHIDGDKRNNEISNLRDVTSSENKKNLRKSSKNTSGFVGVTRHKRDQRWQAQIQIDGKVIYLGQFQSKSAALAARKEAEITYGFHKYHGS